MRGGALYLNYNNKNKICALKTPTLIGVFLWQNRCFLWCIMYIKRLFMKKLLGVMCAVVVFMVSFMLV